jgi:hypothetical protein
MILRMRDFDENGIGRPAPPEAEFATRPSALADAMQAALGAVRARQGRPARSVLAEAARISSAADCIYMIWRPVGDQAQRMEMEGHYRLRLTRRRHGVGAVERFPLRFDPHAGITDS